ncbi:hypothetical protein [Falsiroseomonas sp.]|uniref:hypothetical protein n=1 Tax=Falsiroseomonas sp. TaxID=2870721 RepID=UPI0035646C88
MSGTPIFKRLTNGNDRYSNPATGEQVIYGLAGNDTITTSITRRDGTPDVLFGGDGNDRVTGGGSSDRLYGGLGRDTMDGGDGNDLIDGDGDDRDPEDTLFGPDQIVASDDVGDDDTLDGGRGDDTIFGRGGDDFLRGSWGTDILYGGDGNDRLDAGGDSSGDTLHGGAGDDTLDGSFGDNLLTGGSGADSMDGGAGADTLEGGEGIDFLAGGDGDDLLSGGAGADTINGGGGFDIVNYFDSDAGVNVQLASTLPGVGGHAAGDLLSNIEGAIGSDHNDTLVGTGGDNILLGRAGNDIVIGGAGADTLNGGDGIDRVEYAGTAAGVDVNLVTGLVTGGDTDTIAAFENVFGSLTGDDTLTGDNAANLLAGLGGNDILIGGAGPDTLDGGDGIDTVDYSASPRRPSAPPNPTDGVLVVLGAQVATGTGSHADGDAVIGVENVIGSAFNDSILGATSAAAAAVDNLLDGGAGNDTLIGFAGADTLLGGAGNDILVGGDGADSLLGGDGIDDANYSSSVAAVSVNLATGLGSGGEAAGDTLGGIENVVGSFAASDLLIGDGGNNLLQGLAGNDTLDGGAGNDSLIGGAGGDLLVGGDGIDEAAYVSSAARVIVDLSAGFFSGGDATGDVLIGIENLVGSNLAAQGDILVGNGANNVLQGLAGNDLLNGAAGRDTLVGGAGSDLFQFSATSHSPQAAPDLIADFSQAQFDRIDLRPLGAGFEFIGTDAFANDGTAQLRYQRVAATATVIEVDANGDLTVDMAIVALHASTQPIAFVAGDFLLA